MLSAHTTPAVKSPFYGKQLELLHDNKVGYRQNDRGEILCLLVPKLSGAKHAVWWAQTPYGKSPAQKLDDTPG